MGVLTGKDWAVTGGPDFRQREAGLLDFVSLLSVYVCVTLHLCDTTLFSCTTTFVIIQLLMKHYHLSYYYQKKNGRDFKTDSFTVRCDKVVL